MPRPAKTLATRTILGHANKPSRLETIDWDDSKEVEAEGSVLGASLLFAGTAIGAGMLALPAETSSAGYVPSISSLLLCWAFTVVTSLITLEASWEVGKTTNREASFLSISKETLGPGAEAITAILFWFLLTSIIIAYTSEGGTLLSQFAREQLGSSGWNLSESVGSVLFTAFFSSLAIFGIEQVELVNRFLVAGLISSFLGLLAVGIPQLELDHLSYANWNEVYPTVISVGILSFGAQNIVPTILEYLGGNSNRARQAVWYGSLIPLLMYTLWETIFLGILPYQDANDSESKMQVFTILGSVGGSGVQELVEIFSACAIGSSMAGASISLVDFFQDAVETMGGQRFAIVESKVNQRIFATLLALGPPLALAYSFPNVFLSALENAGLLGGVSLYGIIPALAVLKLRQNSAKLTLTNRESYGDPTVMPGRLDGGPVLTLTAFVSTCLVLPKISQLGDMIIHSWRHV